MDILDHLKDYQTIYTILGIAAFVGWGYLLDKMEYKQKEKKESVNYIPAPEQLNESLENRSVASF